MKKKIIASLVLVVYTVFSVFALASCGDGPLNEFSKAISATDPSVVNGSVTMYTEYGPLVSSYTASIAEDGSYVINYEYELFDEIGDGTSNEISSKYTGTVTYKDGTYSDSSLAAKITADAAAAKIKLDDKKMSYNISEDGNVLSATVKAAKTKAVFGIEYAADVNLTLTKNAGKIVSLNMTYTLTEGKVEVTANYK